MSHLLKFKPDFIVVGAPKCGTTFLYYNLRQHPEIFLPERKELHYFSAQYLKEHIGGPGDNTVLRHICETEREYGRYFEGAPDAAIKGEVSPSYFVYPQTAESIKSACGGVKIIIMLRNPVEKAFSQYCHLLKEGREESSFEKALQKEEERAADNWNDFWLLTDSSLYFERVKRFIDIFGRDKVKIILLETLSENRSDVLEELCYFLEVDYGHEFELESRYNRSGAPLSPFFTRILTNQNRIRRLIGRFLPEGFKQDLYNRLMDMNTGKKPDLKEETRIELEEVFRDDIRQLEDFLGMETGWLRESGRVKG